MWFSGPAGEGRTMCHSDPSQNLTQRPFGWILAGHVDIYIWSWGKEKHFGGKGSEAQHHHPPLSQVVLDAGEGF